MAKEIKRWITVNGNKVPIYEDGSMGGFMEGKAISRKAKSPKKKESTPETDAVLNARHAMALEAQRPGGPNEEAMRQLKAEYDKAVEEAKSQNKPKKDSANKTDEDFMEKENERWKKEFGNEDAHQWSDDEKDIHYDTKLNDIRERMRKGEITAEQAKDEAFDYEKSQRGNKKWSDVDRNRMESKVRDIFDEADRKEGRYTEDKVQSYVDKAKESGESQVYHIGKDIERTVNTEELEDMRDIVQKAYDKGNISKPAYDQLTGDIDSRMKQMSKNNQEPEGKYADQIGTGTLADRDRRVEEKMNQWMEENYPGKSRDQIDVGNRMAKETQFLKEENDARRELQGGHMSWDKPLQDDAYDREHEEGKYATPEQKERVENAKDLIKHYMDQGKSLEEAKELAYHVKSDKSNTSGNESWVGSYHAAQEDTQRNARSVTSALKSAGYTKDDAVEAYAKANYTTKQNARENIRLMDPDKVVEMVDKYKGKSIKIGNKEVAVNKTAAEGSIKAIRNENGSYSMGDYTISKRTGYEWVRPTNGSRISTKQRKKTGYSVAGKTFDTLSEAKAYVEELMRKKK